METDFRKKMVSINAYGFPLQGNGFPLQGNGFPLHGNFWQNLKVVFSRKIEKNLELFKFFSKLHVQG
jgi:hypothetical protein